MSKRRPSIPEIVEELRLFHHDQAANALQALAPRFVTDLAALSALQQDTIIRDAEGDIFRRRFGRFEEFPWAYFGDATIDCFKADAVMLPAQIMWAPK